VNSLLCVHTLTVCLYFGAGGGQKMFLNSKSFVFQ